ncbi:MAG: DUF4345 family protein, partial [Caldimonas sp.]
MLASQLVVQVCLFIVAAIAMTGGTLQMVLGQPDTAPRLDNVHRFMAGVYFSTGVISLWAALTIREQGTLVYLLALGVLLAGSALIFQVWQGTLAIPHMTELRFGWASFLEVLRQAITSFVIAVLVLAGAGLLAFLATPLPAAASVLALMVW